MCRLEERQSPPCQRFGTRPSSAPGGWVPVMCARADGFIGARAPLRLGVGVVPAAVAAASDTSGYTLAGSPPPLVPARTSPGTPNLADSSPPDCPGSAAAQLARWLTKGPRPFAPYGAAPWTTKAPEGRITHKAPLTDGVRARRSI